MTMRFYQWLIGRRVRCGPLERALQNRINRQFKRQRARHRIRNLG